MKKEGSGYAISALAGELTAGKLTYAQATEELERIEREYQDPFIPTAFTPKERPWDQAYLQELMSGVAVGKASKEYLLHIAEVSEEVYRPKRVKRAVAIAAGIAAVLAVVAVICWVVGKR